MAEIKTTALQDYFGEAAKIGKNGVYQILDQGKSWDFSHTLSQGGSAVFPHTYLGQCGYQIAAVVHGCLDTGADQVLVLGVLHPSNSNLLASRMKEMNGECIFQESSWGVFKPGHPFLQNEFSLFHFKTLWEAEVERRGIKPPKIIERYPCLVNRDPASLPGIEELEKIAKDSVVVATADLCHHGAAYNSQKIVEGEQGLELARSSIDKAFDILQDARYNDFYDHSWQTLSDAMDTCTVLRHLLGSFVTKILALRLVDVSKLFEGEPIPSWVAAALIELNVAQG